MYNPIQLSETENQTENILEKVSLNIFNENTDKNEQSIFTEAVFNNGKETIDPILSIIAEIKNNLESQLSEHVDQNQFDPELFWKQPKLKELEDSIRSIFGFRFVSIEPYIEKYDKSSDTFESKELNCCVYRANRYPIDGIVTDKGFYDQTHSLVMNVYISLGLIHALEPDEILAVFLHEFGHGIDPAIMTIKYAEANILSKYLTDRNSEMTDSEKRVISKKMNILSMFTKFANVFKK